MIGSRGLFVPECRIDPGWSLYDWLRKRQPPHQHPIRCKTKTQSRLGRPRFPALETVCLLLLQALIDSGNSLLCFRWLLRLQIVLV